MTELLLKATIAMCLALVVIAVARRARAAMRHAVLSAMFLLLLLLPFSSALAPKVNLAVNVPAAVQKVVTTAAPATAAAPVTQAVRFDAFAIARTVYAGVAALLLLSLAIGMWRLRQWASQSEVWIEGIRIASEIARASGIRRAVLVVLSADVTVPMTFGFRRQTIVLPLDAENWPDGELRRALRHELEHVQRDDWAMQLVARATAALYWPHPLVWFSLRRFCVEAERACDDAVVRSFEPSSYAEQLVTLARSLRRPANVPVLAMASPTRLSERVGAILDAAQARGPQSGLARGATAGVMLVTLAFLASFTVVSNAAVSEAVEEGVRGALDENEYAPSEVMIKAAERGNIRVMTRLLDDGVDVNTAYSGDGTALLIASKYGQLEAVKFLLSRGARIDEIVPGDETALINAAWQGHADVVRLLIARGANANLGAWSEFSDMREWRTPLRMAERAGHDDIVRILTAAGARD